MHIDVSGALDSNHSDVSGALNGNHSDASGALNGNHSRSFNCHSDDQGWLQQAVQLLDAPAG